MRLLLLPAGVIAMLPVVVLLLPVFLSSETMSFCVVVAVAVVVFTSWEVAFISKRFSIDLRC
jgi:hypothetical protein